MRARATKRRHCSPLTVIQCRWETGGRLYNLSGLNNTEDQTLHEPRARVSCESLAHAVTIRLAVEIGYTPRPRRFKNTIRWQNNRRLNAPRDVFRTNNNDDRYVQKHKTNPTGNWIDPDRPQVTLDDRLLLTTCLRRILVLSDKRLLRSF